MGVPDSPDHPGPERRPRHLGQDQRPTERIAPYGQPGPQYRPGPDLTRTMSHPPYRSELPPDLLSGPGSPGPNPRRRSRLRTVLLVTAGVAVLLVAAAWFAWPRGAAVSTAGTGETSGAAPVSPEGSVASPSASVAPSLTRSPTPVPSAKVPVVPKPVTGGKPGPANTGVPKGVKLTVVNGSQLYTKDGQVISGLDVHGQLTVRAKNVIIKNSIIRGAPNPRCNSAVLDLSDSSGVTVQDSEIAPAYPSPCLDGVWAIGTTMLRMNIHGATDGIKAFDNVVLRDSWVHDMDYFSNDPNQGGGPTHNDAIQTYEGNQHITIKHNTLSPGPKSNAAYQVSQDGGKVAKDLHIDSNWLDWGGCTLNFAANGGPPMSGIYVTNNRFGRNSVFDCPILVSLQTTLSQNSGNVWDNNGKPIPAPERHD